jgi:hypothetical protein
MRKRYIKLHHDSRLIRHRSKLLPLMFIIRYLIPGIAKGSSKALLEMTSCGKSNWPSLFFFWLACSVLIELEGVDG